jgi:hypothetical protein
MNIEWGDLYSDFEHTFAVNAQTFENSGRHPGFPQFVALQVKRCPREGELVRHGLREKAIVATYQQTSNGAALESGFSS